MILLRTRVCQTILVFLVSSHELTLESQEVYQKRLLEEPFRELAQSTNLPAQTEILLVFRLELYHQKNEYICPFFLN